MIERRLSEYEISILHSFPVLSQQELDEVNDLYKHYIFYTSHKHGRTIATSCCHRKEEMYYLVQTITPEYRDFIATGHNKTVTCPFCGRTATMKNTAKIKECHTLTEYHQIAIWHSKDRAIYIQTYWTKKAYSKSCLTGEVGYITCVNYHFMPDDAMAFYKDDESWRSIRIQDPIDKLSKMPEPFGIGGIYSGCYAYNNIGRDKAIENLSYKYSQLEKWTNYSNSGQMRYLTLYSLYPRAVEMLMKTGMKDVISEWIYNGVKNARAINWNETDPRKAFDLSKEELRDYMQLKKKDIGLISAYKCCRRNKWKTSFEDLEGINTELKLNKIITYAKKYKTTPKKIFKYLESNTGGCWQAGGYRTLETAYGTWRDYIQAAEAIGYDTNNPVVVFPRMLYEKHDIATLEHNRRLEEAITIEERKRRAEAAKRNKEEQINFAAQEAEREKRETEERNNRENRYCWQAGEFFIRPASNADEIIAEGKALEHCVGGYADRHVKGKLTICFMRKVNEPDKSFITIEMHGTQMMQIHGYKNERKNAFNLSEKAISPAPEILYKDFLDPWLEWVKAGSKRDESGNPIIKIKEKTA